MTGFFDSASFYIGISYAVSTLAFVGVGIKVSHSVGEKKYKNAIEYVLASLFLIFVISITVTTLILFFKHSLIDFFNIKSQYIVDGAINYLTIVTPTEF